jgi:hypothetical protein
MDLSCFWKTADLPVAVGQESRVALPQLYPVDLAVGYIADLELDAILVLDHSHRLPLLHGLL